MIIEYLNEDISGIMCSYENRKIILESIRYADEVISEYSWEQKVRYIVNNDIDISFMGLNT